MKPIPLFGSELKSYSQAVSSQRRLNMMYDIRVDNDRSSIVAVNTPGSSLFITLPTYPIRGWRVINQYLYVLAGNTLYRVFTDGSYVIYGTIGTSTGYVSMADNSVVLMIVDGVQGYLVSLPPAAVAAPQIITDTNFPNGANSVAMLDTRFIVNQPLSTTDTRRFAVSQLFLGLSGSTTLANCFSATDGSGQIYGTKENYSDTLVAVEVYSGVLILWGKYSIELWQDVASTPLPYARINGATQSWGLAAPYSHAEVGNTVVFLGANPDGGLRVMQLAGSTLTAISTSDIDYIITHLSFINDAVALAYTAYGHPVYQLTFPTANITLAYDLATNVWHQAQTGTAIQARHYASLGIVYNQKNYVADASSGAIYILDENTYQDNGTTIPREICTRHIRGAGNQISLMQLYIDIETGVGNSTTSNPQVFVSFSKDNGKTFGPERQKSLGAIGQYITRVTFNRMGAARDFVVKLRTTDSTKFVVLSGSAVVEAVDG